MIVAPRNISTLVPTYDSDGEYPQEEPVQHHGHVLPVLLHLVAVLLPPSDLRNVAHSFHCPDQFRTQTVVRRLEDVADPRMTKAGVEGKLPVELAAGLIIYPAIVPGGDK